MLRDGQLRRDHSRGGDDGSALMLMPAAVLVLVLLASLAVDGALVWMAQRELANRAAAAANDIAATAIDEDRFYETGEVALDPARAERILADHLAWEPEGGLRSITVTELAVEGRRVRLVLSGTARAIFAPAVARDGAERTIQGTAVAHAAG